MINMTFTEPCKYFMFNMSAWGDYEITFLSGGIPVAIRTLSFINGESKQLFLYNIPPTDFSIQIMLTSQKGYIHSLGYSTGPKMEPVPDIKIISAECLNKFGVTGGNVTFDIAYAWNITSQDQVLIEIFYDTIKIGEKKQTIAPFLSARDETLVSAHIPNISGELCLTINVSLVQARVSDIIEYHLNILPSSVGIHSVIGPTYIKSEASWNIWDRELKFVDKSELQALEVKDIEATQIIYNENAIPQYVKLRFNARNKYRVDFLYLLSANVHYVVEVTVNISNKEFDVPLGLLIAGDSSDFEFFIPVHFEGNQFVVNDFKIIYWREPNIGVAEIGVDAAKALLDFLCPDLPLKLALVVAPVKVSVEEVAKYFLLYMFVEFYSGKIGSQSLDLVIQYAGVTQEEKQIIQELQRRGFTNIQSILGIINLRRLEGRISPTEYLSILCTLFNEWLYSDMSTIIYKCFNRALEKVASEIIILTGSSEIKEIIKKIVPQLLEEALQRLLKRDISRQLSKNLKDLFKLIFSVPQAIVTSVSQLMAPNYEGKCIDRMQLSEWSKMKIDPTIRVGFNVDFSEFFLNVTDELYLTNFYVNLLYDEATIIFYYDQNFSSIYELILNENYAKYYLSLFNFNASAINILCETGKITVHAEGNLIGECKRLELNINQTNMIGWAEGSLAAYLENGHFSVNRKITLPFGNKYITSVALTLPNNSTISEAAPAGYGILNNTIIWNATISQFAVNFTAPTDICISKIAVPDFLEVGQEVNIQVIVTNNGSFPLALKVGVNYTRITDPVIGVKNIVISPGESITLNFTWTPTSSGRYQILAYTTEIPNDIDPHNNKMEAVVYIRYQTISSTGGIGFRKNLLK